MRPTPSSPSEQFRTRSLYLAAFLKLGGVRPARLEVQRGRGSKPTVRWYYEPEPGLDEMVRQFEQREARVEPREFADCLNQVRSEMFDFIEHNANDN
jgi:hypothetical protein